MRSQGRFAVELDTKIDQFQSALKELLGLTCRFTTKADSAQSGGSFRGVRLTNALSVTPVKSSRFITRSAATAETALIACAGERERDPWKTTL